jgi:medium-chain acyl-[acyl-carrier-protein] hydrolase
MAEKPFDDFGALVTAIADAITPHLDRPFAFFGHSMGALIAFELTRLLRRTNQPQPVALYVSGARAPQFRLNHKPGPDPSDSELLDQLRRLEGTPAELLASPEVLQLLLPALRADTTAYRNYVYHPDVPLACPIFAYGGAGDENINRDHLEAWQEQTTSSFKLQILPGGHFFLRTAEREFLALLSHDVEPLLK